DGVAVAGDLHVLVGPARVPDPGIDRGVDLAARLPLRHALGAANLVDELCATPLEELGDAVEHLATVVARCAGPAVERLARGDHRVTGILARGLGGIREELA